MLAEHNVLGIEIGGYLKGYAEGPLGISALVIMIVLIVNGAAPPSGPASNRKGIRAIRFSWALASAWSLWF
jgi:hypothetical protein